MFLIILCLPIHTAFYFNLQVAVQTLLFHLDFCFIISSFFWSFSQGDKGFPGPCGLKGLKVGFDMPVYLEVMCQRKNK